MPRPIPKDPTRIYETDLHRREIEAEIREAHALKRKRTPRKGVRPAPRHGT